MSVRWVSRPCHQTSLRGGSVNDAKGAPKSLRTEQLDFEPNLSQRLDEVGGLLRRDVATVTSEHVQAVRPVRPARRVGRNSVREGALGREEGERQWRRDERRAGRCCARGVEGRRAVRGGDFRDEREVKTLG